MDDLSSLNLVKLSGSNCVITNDCLIPDGETVSTLHPSPVKPDSAKIS